MAVDTTNENLSVNKLVCEKKEMIFIQGDMIVPDSKPDILNTIHTSGTACVYKKEIMEDKVRIDGNINTYIMYLADNTEDHIRGINTNLDFTEIINIPNCKENMLLESQLEIKSIECKVLNGRKVNIKVGLEVNLKIYSNENVNIVNNIDDIKDIQILRKNLMLNSLVGSGNTKVYVKDTLVIDNLDSLAEILKVDINLVDRDIKVSYNKVLAKAEAEVRVMYLTEENQIRNVTNRIPVVGFIDIQEVAEENICDTNYEIKNMVIKPNSVEEHSIYVELEVEISCIAYEEKSIYLIQDLYSPCEEVEFNERTIRTIKGKNNSKNICQIREKVNIPELQNNQILDIDIKTAISNEKILNNRLVYEGELEISFMFLEDDGKNINKKINNIPFRYEIENITEEKGRTFTTQIEIKTQDFILQENGNIDCNIDLVFCVNSYVNTDVNIIEEIESKEKRNMQDYSIIIYVIKPGDTLWKISKKFKSTIEDIAQLNNIENPEVINVGEKLIIPKYVKKRMAEKQESPININYA